ncbi:MAG: cupin domain-containing protein [Alphaproteobacteria bacterium]
MDDGAPRPDAGLISDLEASDIHPLWDRYKRITPITPAPDDPPFVWRWKDIDPFTARAATEIAMEDAERRALIMAHPAFGGKTQTTHNLLSAFTVLEPGDKALPHRHTAAAIRFSTRAEGAVTIVNGRRCEMLPGDLVLTPPWCWHGHINESDSRIMWFDAANIPLINNLDVNFFDPGNRDGGGDNAFWEVDEGDERLWQAAGLVADGHGHTGQISPKYRYPGEDTRRMLDGMRPREDGARVLRYVNPLTGGAVMPTLDCYAMRLSKNQATTGRRATWNAICMVVAGEGKSTIGDQEIAWGENDTFTIPHWTWASHQAVSADADLFIVTDREVHERLDVAREEIE